MDRNSVPSPSSTSKNKKENKKELRNVANIKILGESTIVQISLAIIFNLKFLLKSNLTTKTECVMDSAYYAA